MDENWRIETIRALTQEVEAQTKNYLSGSVDYDTLKAKAAHWKTRLEEFQTLLANSDKALIRPTRTPGAMRRYDVERELYFSQLGKHLSLRDAVVAFNAALALLLSYLEPTETIAVAEAPSEFGPAVKLPPGFGNNLKGIRAELSDGTSLNLDGAQQTQLKKVISVDPRQSSGGSGPAVSNPSLLSFSFVLLAALMTVVAYRKRRT